MSETVHKMQHYTCKRLRLLQYLRERGFTPFSTIPDPTNVKYNWWLFDNTAELQAAVTEYFNKLKEKQQ